MRGQTKLVILIVTPIGLFFMARVPIRVYMKEYASDQSRILVADLS